MRPRRCLVRPNQGSAPHCQPWLLSRRDADCARTGAGRGADRAEQHRDRCQDRPLRSRSRRRRQVRLRREQREPRALRSTSARPHARDGQGNRTDNRGIAYAGLNNPSAALNDFNRAIATRPNFSNTLLNRAKVYLSLGNTAAAIRDYEDVLRLKPDNEEARSALATLRGATPPQMGPSAANSLCGAPGCN